MPFLARAAVAVGVDGIFIETHPTPDRAVCDSTSQLPLERLEGLTNELVQISHLVSALDDIEDSA